MSFAGGGSDLPSFFREEEGAVLSTAIDRYMYITVNKRFDQTVRLSYSRTEIKESVDGIEHPIFRTVLKKYAPQGGLELISMADVPSGTGLGSSSSFTVGLLHALKAYQGKFQSADELASEACDIEINELKEPIGKQDQYMAAHGGLQFVRFQTNGEVFVDPVICTTETKANLEKSLLIFYTGKTRDAKSVLKEQNENTSAKRDTLREMVRMAWQMKRDLEANAPISNLGRTLHEAWQLKKTMASSVSNPQIDTWYKTAIDSGAWGGKILGAGNGGFLMLLAPPESHVGICKRLSDLREMNLKFENQGSKILFVG